MSKTKKWKRKRLTTPKLREWSPKVDDPRQLDLLHYAAHKPLREGFARLDDAIAQAFKDDGKRGES